MRIGQDESRHQRAVKVWDRREFRNLDDTVELGTRNIKVALRRLRKWARDGAAEELDLDGTIRATAEHGWLDVQVRPERRNAVKVLLFLDVGGSMDPYVKVMEELFSAARSEFKHLKVFYFHNCLYEGVWTDNRPPLGPRRPPPGTCCGPMGRDYRCIFVGDASHEPLRDPASGRRERALERGNRAGLAGAGAGAMAAATVDQPGAGTVLGHSRIRSA